MGIIRLEFSRNFIRNYEKIKRNEQLQKAVDELLVEICKNPTSGSGKAERLRYANGNRYSRRVDKKNRVVYDYIPCELVVVLLQCLGHYDDH